MRIVIVEDNESVAKGIAYVLRDTGHAVDLIHDGAQADDFLQNDGSDLIVLDVNLPGLDGIQVLKKMRLRGDGRPVLLLTARSSTDERIEGLDAGADDYLVKPFEMPELEARIRALSRRRESPVVHPLTLGTLTFDPGRRQLLNEAGEIDLPRREMSVLETLVNAQGRTVSKSQLLDNVYGTGADVEDSVIEVNISRLRRRLKPHGVGIKVRRGLGYQLQLDT